MMSADADSQHRVLDGIQIRAKHDHSQTSTETQHLHIIYVHCTNILYHYYHLLFIILLLLLLPSPRRLASGECIVALGVRLLHCVCASVCPPSRDCTCVALAAKVSYYCYKCTKLQFIHALTAKCSD